MIFCSVFRSTRLPLSLKRDSRITPLNFAQSASVPLSGASPSLKPGVAALSAGVFCGGE